MGNCLVLEDNKAIKVVKTDGKFLEYKAPTEVHKILREFSGHAISNSILDSQHLQPDTKLLSGRLYSLVPLALPSPKTNKKKVRFANPEVEDKQGVAEGVDVVKIKLVISKQELQKLLQGGSVHETVSQTFHKQRFHAADESDDGVECK